MTHYQYEKLTNCVKAAALSTQRHDWEQGVLAQAFWELGDTETAFCMAMEAANRQIPDGRCSQLDTGSSVTDPCSIGSVLIEAAESTRNDTLIHAKDALLDWALIRAPRNKDGIIYHVQGHPEFWVDSFYMLPPFLMRAGYYNEAMQQIDGWWNALYREELGLLAHRWDDEMGTFIRQDAWGVGNGWAMAGMVRVLSLLPDMYKTEKDRLINRILSILNHVRSFQLDNGMFPNVLNDSGSFPEVNFGQMLAYTVWRGQYEGWLDSSYSDMAERCYDAAVQSIDAFGFVRNVCGIPDFDRSSCSPEGQAFFLLMESARRRIDIDIISQ